MTITAIINMITQTESGKSQSSGNEWKSKYIIVEIEEENERKNTLVLQTMNHDIINQIEKMVEGDKVEIDFSIKSCSYRTAKGYVRRYNEAFIRSIKTIDEKGF